MKIAIAGYGLEGESSYRYFNRPENQITIVDERQPALELPESAEVIIGESAFSQLDDYDIVVRTPGLNPSKIKTNGKIWSATNEFFARCPAPIIGATGSKGKGTTCSLIASILRAAGKTVHLVGNIGVPALDVLPSISAEDVVVYELSSFQLWDIKRSPHVAVVLMIEADHLDVHADFNDYVNAKTSIARYQGEDDIVVYNFYNDQAAEIAAASAAMPIGYPTHEAAHVENNSFYYGEQQLCSLESLKLPGAHNQDNACAAISAVWPYVQDGEVIAAGLAAFTGLDHRLKLVGEVDGVKFYDDSIATTPGSAEAAIKAFTQSKVLILGGSSKGASFGQLAQTAAQDDVKHVLAIGEEAGKIEHAMTEAGVTVTNLGSSIDMNEIVRRAQQIAEAGNVVVLSPACASFGMFRNYADRGQQFIQAVANL